MHGTNGFRSIILPGRKPLVATPRSSSPNYPRQSTMPTNGKPGCRRFSWFARIGVKRALQRHKPKGAASSDLVDARMPPIMSFPRQLRARKIWIDDALGSAARCRLITLRQRGIGAFDVAPPIAVDLQAGRIVRAICLGQSRRCRQNHDGRQNRQSRNAHQNLSRD
jgi:hypothetical protein